MNLRVDLLQEKHLKLIKWFGTIFLLCGVALNTLNTPEWQQYVYPFNLYVSLAGSLMLLMVARIQNDLPYMVLNSIVMLMYIVGVYHAFCGVHNLHLFGL